MYSHQTMWMPSQIPVFDLRICGHIVSSSLCLHATTLSVLLVMYHMFGVRFRCGKLTKHIPYPDSLLSKRHFQVALFNAYFGNPCNCDPTQHNSDTSQLAENQNHEAASPRRHETQHGRHHSRHSAQNRHH